MELQSKLIAEGFLKASATGYFGPATFAAVKAYQSSKGLPSTGFVGPMTIAKLNAEAGAQASTPAASASAGISAKSFVELLISIGAIKADKAAAARTAVSASN
jgi:N-acetylmuramoyl-L-alanine amidase